MFILSSVVLYISTKFVHGEDISMMEESVKFDCSRLPITYCCTTRVRTTCKVQCSTIRCDSGFYKRDKKLKQLVVGPQTIYKNGLNDGDTADLHSGIQMKRTNRKPSPQNLSKKMYLPAPTSSDENESLVNMSSEDISVMPSVTATVSSFNCGLEPSCITEPQVSTNIDVSVCTILHIIPIVQCASNERDNSECCRYKQITAKSAPQCEIFCRSGQEITRLGLEHLLCRKVMDEIIACHLSGLRS
ncbi:unnamed protein product [Acanthocheilonema viteae]|uniref:Domain of unknown function DB domain-containing protein n=1 Tax=Acanthocheilonema viteae TaxID=6277 RepID=A0A498SJY2_ACAVI|nr:unnamed protein product [Acanthocheilonema viteae]